MTGNGDWLKRSRKRAGFARQEDLAEALGVTRSAVANWEAERGDPDMANAEKLAVLLHRPRAEVLARFGHPIGAGETITDLPALPPEWLAAIRVRTSTGGMVICSATAGPLCSSAPAGVRSMAVKRPPDSVTSPVTDPAPGPAPIHELRISVWTDLPIRGRAVDNSG